jgi:CHASE2 domain-containing sensor protein
MSLKSRLSEHWRRGAWGAGLTVLLSLCLLALPPFGSGLKQVSYDFPFFFRSDINVEEAVIVAMDHKSFEVLAQDPKREWDRSLHAALLTNVLARGAKAVVFDVVFVEPWPDPAVDKRFAEALKQAQGKVVLAASLQGSEVRLEGGTNRLRAEVSRLVQATDAIGTNAVWGIVEQFAGTDLAIRQHYYHPDYPSLAWKVSELVGHAPADPARPRWINYYGARGALRQASYFQVLSNDLAPDFFANKVVFVGKTPVLTTQGIDRADLYRTPYTRWTGRLLSGVEVQATVFLNLFRRDWLERVAPALEMGLFVLFALLFGFGLGLVRPGTAVALAALGAPVVTGGACLLVWGGRLWFPWLAVVSAQVPFALSWALLGRVQKTDRDKAVRLEPAWAPTSALRAVPVAPQNQPAGEPLGTTTLAPSIPDYSLLRCVGKGAYGEVWLARDVIGSYHAVKIVRRKSFRQSAPFEREFRGIKKFAPISLSHPGFLHILHVGINSQEDYFYYVMELADDQRTGRQIDPHTYVPRNLAREIATRGCLPVSECIQLGLDLTAALDHLHQQQLIHRDIKPSNIIIVNGAPKFADIGLVTDLATPAKRVTFLGTQGYIAPEGPGTAAADLFSLGIVLYEASMGRDPGQFPELPTTLGARPDQVALRQFHDIVCTACETDPADRYQSAAELRAALLELRGHLGPAENSAA